MIEDLFREYKKMTSQIIDGLEKDLDVSMVMQSRQGVLEKINDVQIEGSKKKQIYIELGIDKLDKDLGDLIKKKQAEVKEEIKTNRLRRQTTNSYSSVMREPNLFSRRV